MLLRALVRTHHMTSRKKKIAVVRAAKNYKCSVYLKTGLDPPGLMIAECKEEDKRGLEKWLFTVKVCGTIWTNL